MFVGCWQFLIYRKKIENTSNKLYNKKQKNQTEKKDKKIVIKRAKELGSLLGKTFI